MSGGIFCRCEDKAEAREKHWRVTAYRMNRSAFNGYRDTYSQWSAVRCEACGWTWRTKAAYADALRHANR